jgi:hypothetical protein
LFKNQLIKQFLAAVLFLLFALGNTPKIALHDIIAGHKDRQLQPSSFNANQQQLIPTGFNCNIDHFVAESPFTDNPSCSDLTTNHLFKQETVERTMGILAAACIHLSLRGPPVLS